jgi:hypothetical protein
MLMIFTRIGCAAAFMTDMAFSSLIRFVAPFGKFIGRFLCADAKVSFVDADKYTAGLKKLKISRLEKNRLIPAAS